MIKEHFCSEVVRCQSWATDAGGQEHVQGPFCDDVAKILKSLQFDSLLARFSLLELELLSDELDGWISDPMIERLFPEVPLAVAEPAVKQIGKELRKFTQRIGLQDHSG